LQGVKKIAVVTVIALSLAADAQVKISVPSAVYKTHDKIDVEIVNAGTSDVTFCVEYGYLSFVDSNHSEPTPTPVHVQQKNSHRWSTLLTGPDIGSARHPDTLRPGESQHFPFRVNAHGTVRIVLRYPCGDLSGLSTGAPRSVA